MPLFKRNISAVVTLFFVAPLVAEYLLGDLPLKMLPALIVLAPAYGGGAILIRETARRMGRGWPMMLLLGAAYTLIAEGLITQSLFNPDYLKMHMHLLDHAYVAAWGIGAWWTLFMFNLHVFWSMGVSIALVEALFPAAAETPWLGVAGDSIIAVLFVAGMAADFVIGFKKNQFTATHAQLLSTAGLSLLLLLFALLFPRLGLQPDIGSMPNAWTTGAVAFVLGMGVLSTPPAWDWGAVCALLAFDALFLSLLAFFSRRTGWNALHTFSVAAAGALDYGIHAFTQKPLLGGAHEMRITNVILLAGATCVVWMGARRILRHQTLPLPGGR